MEATDTEVVKQAAEQLSADTLWLEEARQEIATIRALPEGWSSYPGRPFGVAVDHALRIVEDMTSFGHRPTITPMVNGGVAIRFSHGNKTARIETSDDEDDVVLVTQSSPVSAARFCDIDAARAAAAVDEFFS